MIFQAVLCNSYIDQILCCRPGYCYFFGFVGFALLVDFGPDERCFLEDRFPEGFCGGEVADLELLAVELDNDPFVSFFVEVDSGEDVEVFSHGCLVPFFAVSPRVFGVPFVLSLAQEDGSGSFLKRGDRLRSTLEAKAAVV